LGLSVPLWYCGRSSPYLLSRHVDHRALLSFPTRRSSDLAARAPVRNCPHLAAAAPVPHDSDRGAGATRLFRPTPRSWRGVGAPPDRKSTRLNSSHVKISYAVFCLKKKTL